jgi:hypothetical protein
MLSTAPIGLVPSSSEPATSPLLEHLRSQLPQQLVPVPPGSVSMATPVIQPFSKLVSTGPNPAPASPTTPGTNGTPTTPTISAASPSQLVTPSPSP